MTALLEVHDLDVEIPLPGGRLHAVRKVSLDASPGEAVGLVGESGSGKSLTLRAIMDLLPVPARVSGGTILVDGVDVMTGAPGMPAMPACRLDAPTAARVLAALRSGGTLSTAGGAA